MKRSHAHIGRYAVFVGTIVVVSVFTIQMNPRPAQADDPGIDNYPWINTAYLNVEKNPHSYTVNDANFVADHFDIATAHLWYRWDTIKQRNPHLEGTAFVGLAYQSMWEQQMLNEFYLTHPYTDVEKETVYLHYKCDVTHQNIHTPGCNLTDPQTGQCSGTPAAGCAASTATQLSQSRVPDPDPTYAERGWLMPNYLSQVYKDFGVWDVQRALEIYGDTYLPEGIFWDNILYLGSYEIHKTIEYWGQPDINGVDHQRNSDYHNYFSYVKGMAEQAEGRALTWVGNVNNMFWIRNDGPYYPWVRDTLDDITPESWVSPLDMGEDSTPSWFVDCSDMQEAWSYSMNDGLTIALMTYNTPFEGQYDNPDQRTKIFSIAKYYLVNNPRLFYGYSEDYAALDLPASNWNRIAEVNLGNPRINPPGVRDFYGSLNTNRFFDWNHPGTTLNCSYFDWANVAMARHYDNGLIISRWKGQRWGDPESERPVDDPAYNSYIDPRAYNISNPYGQEYYIIQANGTISPEPVNSVTLATNEASVLLQVCPTGLVGATCGCNGQVLNAGDTCIPSLPPVLENINDVTLAEGEILDLGLSAFDPDCPDGTCVSFRLSVLGQNGVASLTDHGDGTATLRLAPGYTHAGQYFLSVRVEDAGVPPLSDSDEFTLTVTNNTHPPVIVDESDKQIHEQEQLTFTVVATDPYPNDQLTFTASNLPEGATFVDNENNTATFNWLPTLDQAGVYPDILFTATDSEGSTDTETLSITVLDGIADCTPNWLCTDWSVCSSSIQTRTCTDANTCGSDSGRPDEVRGCDSTAPGQITNLSALTP